MRLSQTLVVVIHRHGEVTLGIVLANDVLVEISFYLCGLGHLFEVILVVALA